MKTLYFTCFFCITFICSYAQVDFAPIGAKWTYTDYCAQYPNCQYFTLEVTGDTLIDNILAKKLIYTKQTHNGTALIPEANLIMYGDGNRVFTYFNNDFHLLYDFTAQPGDTLTLELGEFINYYGGTDDFFEDTFCFKTKVDSIGTIVINGEELRTQFVSNIPYEELGACSTHTFDNSNSGCMIIEKIGSLETNSMFGSGSMSLTAGYYGKLRCYEDNNISFNNSNVACDYILQVGTKETQSTVMNFYYNQVESTLNFNETDILTPFQLNIYDASGKRVFKQFYNNKPFDQINLFHLSRGIYFLQINTGQEQVCKSFFLTK